jgi:pheromone a factor receptor
MAENPFPLYATAVFMPIIALPSLILCIPPMYWHFLQRNIAAGSLILWMNIFNFFNFINPFIWPRDNVLEWWDGNVFCDIQAHLQVCNIVALTACATVIARKLAKIMDTRNMTIAPSKFDRNKEKMFDIFWCWGYPFILMALYYIVQPTRYFIFAISGCVASFDTSWPSIVVSWIWGPITALVGAFYAGRITVTVTPENCLTRILGLLILRLFRYRREFHRLISVRNTTKSRFVRLFIMALIFITAFLPYNLYVLYVQARISIDSYDWNTVHGANWNTIIKVPTQGGVRWDRWVNIASGYLLFLLFGTGLEAHNSYKRMLCAVGLGKIFPSLSVVCKSGSSTPSSVTFVKGFASTCASKAKSYFSMSDSATDTQSGSTRGDSIFLDTSITDRPVHLQHISTNKPLFSPSTHLTNIWSSTRSLFNRLFGHRTRQPSILPTFSAGSVDQMSPPKISPVKSVLSSEHSSAWTPEGSASPKKEVRVTDWA